MNNSGPRNYEFNKHILLFVLYICYVVCNDVFVEREGGELVVLRVKETELP